jgi:hypothetical protein
VHVNRQSRTVRSGGSGRALDDASGSGAQVRAVALGAGLALVLAAVGCADLSFKPGASPGDIQRDELACREASDDDETAYATCMKDRGYFVSKAGEALEGVPASR